VNNKTTLNIISMAKTVLSYSWKYMTLQLQGKYSYSLTNKTNSFMKRTLNILLIAMTVGFATSCSPTLSVHSDYDRSADFTSYKTFSIYPLKTQGNVNQLNQDRIVKYLRVEMAKRGFKEANANADLMVNAVTVMKDKKGITATTSYAYGGFYRPYAYWGAPAYTSVSTYDYKDGSLVIDVIDSKSSKMVWTGSGSGEVYKQPKNPEETISNVVGKIMAEFPITATK
jgi:hypothetical protein